MPASVACGMAGRKPHKPSATHHGVAGGRICLPERTWSKGHQLLVWHGRRTCFARSPDCERCVVSALCPKRGVRTKAPAPA